MSVFNGRNASPAYRQTSPTRTSPTGSVTRVACPSAGPFPSGTRVHTRVRFAVAREPCWRRSPRV